MTWGHGQGEEGDRKPWTQHSRRMSLHVCAWLRAVISGVWRCVIFAIFSPQKKTRRWSPWRHKTTKVEPSPGAGAGWRVGEAFLQHTAPFRSGWVLQTLVGAQESFAVGTVVVHVLQGVHTERDEAAACDAPGTKQATHTACYCDLDGSHQTDTCVRAQAVSNSATPWTVAHQASLAMGLSRQEYWSGLPCPSPGDLPNSGIKPMSPGSLALAGGFLTTESPGKICQSPNPWNIWMWSYLEKWVFADVIKDLKIGSSLIMWGGLLKLKDWGPDKRRRHTEIQRGETSPVVQWIRICLPMQGTRVPTLVRRRFHMPWGD